MPLALFLRGRILSRQKGTSWSWDEDLFKEQYVLGFPAGLAINPQEIPIDPDPDHKARP